MCGGMYAGNIVTNPWCNIWEHQEYILRQDYKRLVEAVCRHVLGLEKTENFLNVAAIQLNIYFKTASYYDLSIPH